MNYEMSTSEVREDDDLDSLLSLQLVESQEDDPLVQMFSTSSCAAGSCS